MTQTQACLLGITGHVALASGEKGPANLLSYLYASGDKDRPKLISPAVLSVALGQQSCLSPLPLFCYNHLDSVDWFS